LANALAALASISDPSLKRVIPVEFIEKPSIELGKEEHAFSIQVGADCIDVSNDIPDLGCDYGGRAVAIKIKRHRFF